MIMDLLLLVAILSFITTVIRSLWNVGIEKNGKDKVAW